MLAVMARLLQPLQHNHVHVCVSVSVCAFAYMHLCSSVHPTRGTTKAHLGHMHICRDCTPVAAMTAPPQGSAAPPILQGAQGAQGVALAWLLNLGL